MSAGGKLDQSLDDILKVRRTSTRRGRGGRRTGRPEAAAPVGGVQKTTKGGKQAKAVPTGPAAGAVAGESRIMISNLPLDIEEVQLKDYFATAIDAGKPRRILMNYGPTGRSNGSATVIFNRPEQATKALKALDNIRIDNRLIKVDLLVSAQNAPVTVGTGKGSLADRISQPKKDKPKPATATKTAEPAGRGRGRGRGGRGGRAPRDKKKTVEELDAEMADYFPEADGNAPVNGAGQAAVGGDTAMDDEML